jgi:hypothetical protein
MTSASFPPLLTAFEHEHEHEHEQERRVPNHYASTARTVHTASSLSVVAEAVSIAFSC